MSDDADSAISVPKPDVGHPEITMAPLIDVVFLLLIFFMVATVFPDNKGLVIEKPQSKQSAPVPGQHIVITVTKDDKIVFEGKPVTVDGVEPLVRERLRLAPAASVMLHVDRRVSTGTLVRLMDACKSAGAGNLGIATDAVVQGR